MYRVLGLIFVATVSQFAAAQERPAITEVGRAQYQFGDRRFADVFKSSLIFGHSISSSLRAIPVIGFRYGKGPGNVLAEDYAQVPVMANIAEGAGTVETGLTKMNRWLTHEQDSDAKPGTARDIDVMNNHFDKSSVIVGVDALYMAASFNECGDYGARGVANIIEMFVTKAYTSDKVLILGNVPKENRSSFAPIARLPFILPRMNEHCRQVINHSLAYSCTPARNCYIADLAGLVNTLNTTGQLKLKDGTILKDNPSYWGYLTFQRDVRPDGVNLSHRGVQAVVEDILEKLEQNPPRPRVQPTAPAVEGMR